MHIRTGSSVNYSESINNYELAVIDTTDKDSNTEVAIPAHLLDSAGGSERPELPFTIRCERIITTRRSAKKPNLAMKKLKPAPALALESGGEISRVKP